MSSHIERTMHFKILEHLSAKEIVQRVNDFREFGELYFCSNASDYINTIYGSLRWLKRRPDDMKFLVMELKRTTQILVDNGFEIG